MSRVAANVLRTALLAGMLSLTQARAAEATGSRGVTIRLGDSVSTAVSPPGDLDTYVLDAFAGTVVSFTVKPGKQSELLPFIEVLSPSGSVVDLSSHLRRKGVRLSVRRLSLPDTGRYAVRIGGQDGTGGRYELRTRGSAPRRHRVRGLVLGPGETGEIPFGAMTDARVSFRIKAREGEFEVSSVEDPEGRVIPGQAELFDRKGRTTRGPLFPVGAFGEYRLEL
ncbi:MAG: hypothetical protein ACYTDY_17500, partial [Planctomycetota bacterium]